MKRITAAFLASAMILSLAACSQPASKDNSEKNNASTAAVSGTSITKSSENSRLDNDSDKTPAESTEECSKEASAKEASDNEKSSDSVLKFKKPDFWGSTVNALFQDFPIDTIPPDEENYFSKVVEMNDEGNGIYSVDIDSLDDFHHDALYVMFDDGVHNYPHFVHYFLKEKQEQNIKIESGMTVEPINETENSYTYVDEIKFDKPDYWDDKVIVSVEDGSSKEVVEMKKQADGLYSATIGKNFYKPEFSFTEESGRYLYPDTYKIADFLDPDYKSGKVYGGNNVLKGSLAHFNVFNGYEEMTFTAEDIRAIAESSNQISSLQLEESVIQNDAFSELGKLNGLQNIELSICSGFDDLSGLNSDSLIGISFYQSNITEDILKTLDTSKCPELKHIDIFGNDQKFDVSWLTEKGIEVSWEIG